MTEAQIEAVFDRYETRLKDILSASDDALSDACVNKEQIEHALSMILKMRAMYAQEDGPFLQKLHRWIGFLQGVLYCNGIYTIDEMREHNQ